MQKLLKNNLNSLNKEIVKFQKVKKGLYNVCVQPPKSRKRIPFTAKTKKEVFESYPKALEIQ